MLAFFFPGHIIAPVIISFFCFPFKLFGVRVSECFFATMPMLLLNFIKFTWIIAFYALYMADGTEDVTQKKIRSRQENYAQCCFASDGEIDRGENDRANNFGHNCNHHSYYNNNRNQASIRQDFFLHHSFDVRGVTHLLLGDENGGGVDGWHFFALIIIVVIDSFSIF